MSCIWMITSGTICSSRPGGRGRDAAALLTDFAQVPEDKRLRVSSAYGEKSKGDCPEPGRKLSPSLFG
jgi:hypothetical protein